jgi:transcriptional regulator with XRE-family HTH domain
MSELIGSKIRKIRELKGYSQDYMSSKLAITQNAYSKIENGHIKIDNDKLKSIAEALEVSEEDILNFDSSMVFYNCTQSGQINTQYNNPIQKIEELYDAIVKQLREENEFLRRQLEAK